MKEENNEIIDYQDIDLTTLDLNEIAMDPSKLKEFTESFQDLKDAMDTNDHIYVPALVASFNKAISSKKQVVDEIKKIEEFYLFQVLLSQFIDDAVNPDVYTSDILTVSSNDPKVQKEVESFQDKFNLDLLVLDLLPELLKYGTYCLKTEIKEGKGIVDLYDITNSEYIVPVTKHGEIEGYLYQDKEGLKIAPISDFINFSLIGEKMRISTANEFSAYGSQISEFNKLPTYLRLGKSMFYNIRTKIKELQLLEALVPASKLAKLSNGSLVGVRVPASYGIAQAIKFSRKVQNSINKQVGVNPDRDQMTIENMINSSGKIKTVPIFGDKGMLDKLDYKSDEPDDLLSSINDIRQVICTSVGVPFELLFGGEESKGAILKKQSRYVRKLRSIQGSVARSVVDLLMIHFGNLGGEFENISRDDIDVQFRQTLSEVENLDKLEFADASVQMVRSVVEFVKELSNPDESSISKYMKPIELAGWVGDQLSIVGLNIVNDDLIKQDQDTNTDKGIEKEEEELI